ncbi:MAG: IS66 family transposase [Eubacteriales bacterium]
MVRKWETVDAFFSLLDTVNPSGGSKLSKAVGYARGECKYLYAFLDDPLVPVSNNAAENAIRPFVIYRPEKLAVQHVSERCQGKRRGIQHRRNCQS